MRIQLPLKAKTVSTTLLPRPGEQCGDLEGKEKPGAEVTGNQQVQAGFYERTLKVHEKQNCHRLYLDDHEKCLAYHYIYRSGFFLC
jgi:hypothetical protein